MTDHSAHTASHGSRAGAGPYLRLLAMFVLHFFAMYVLMYAMVDRLQNVHPNHNQLYMAALMAAPMIALELVLMGAMYPRKAWNIGIAAAAVLLGALAFLLIRQQTAIGDEQFLRSMIPHHAGAILMCEQAPIADPEIAELCAGIIAGQQEEIDWMTAKLEELD